jgi:DNA-binding transcriptional LysR family regulator
MDDLKLDIRRLRYFVVVAHELSFSRAATLLHMAQPPISYQIKQLERDLGVELFERTGRGVRLTEVGQVLLEEARRIFVALEQTERMIERIGKGTVGRLNLGFVPSASNEVLPPLLHRFRAEFPAVELFLQEMKPDEIVQRLLNTRIDIGFFYLPFVEEALEFVPISREALVVALPEAHPLAEHDTIDLPLLANEPFIMPMRYSMPGLYEQVMAVCRQAGFTPRAVQKDVWLMQTIVGLVAGSIGVALVPNSLRNYRRHGVAYREVRDLSPTVEMAAVWRRGDNSAVLRSFLGVIQAYARSMIPPIA